MERLREGLLSITSKIRRASLVDQRLVKEVVRDVQRELLKADVPVDIVLDLSKRIEDRALKEELPPGFSRRELLLKILYEELVGMLGGEKTHGHLPPGKGRVVMLIGLQGSGKTTTAAKLASYYAKQGLRAGLVCADNYRPGAYEQLKQLSEKAGAEFFGDPGADPVDVALRGVEEMRRRGLDIIIIDTAGRHKEEKELLDEMTSIAERVKPDEVVLVLDATMGKQAGAHAEAFHKRIPIGSIVLTKMDGAARGGGALAAVVRTGARISFIGVGEKLEELEPFDPPSFVSRMLGMGDLKAIVEKFRELELKERPEVFLTGRFTLLDFRDQLESLAKMGPLRKVLELLPGAPQISSDVEAYSSQNIKKWLAIMNSMTRKELENPDIIDKSRMLRIARGSGTTVKDVRELLATYRRARKMMRQIGRSRRGLRGLGIRI